MVGAVVMVILLVIVFPVAVLMTCGAVAAALGGALKADADARNRSDGAPNEYLALSRSEAETPYPLS